MKNTFQMVFAATIFCCLVACVPMFGTYYAPTASEGRAGGDGRAPEILHLTRGDKIYIEIFTALDNTDPNGRVVVDISMPQSDVLGLVPEDVRITGVGSETIADLTMVQAYPLPNLPPDRRLDKLDLTISDLSGSRYAGGIETVYSLTYGFKSPRPDSFHVRLPAMRADGKEYSPLDILFTKTHGWWIQAMM